MPKALPKDGASSTTITGSIGTADTRLEASATMLNVVASMMGGADVDAWGTNVWCFLYKKEIGCTHNVKYVRHC